MEFRSCGPFMVDFGPEIFSLSFCDRRPVRDLTLPRVRETGLADEYVDSFETMAWTCTGNPYFQLPDVRKHDISHRMLRPESSAIGQEIVVEAHKGNGHNGHDACCRPSPIVDPLASRQIPKRRNLLKMLSGRFTVFTYATGYPI